MMIDDVIEIKKADPDSQYRLLPCKKCQSDNVAYEHYNGCVAPALPVADEAGHKQVQRSADEEGALSPTKLPGTANGQGGAAWRVKCFDCGRTVDKGNKVRHDAQMNWNEKSSHTTTESRGGGECT